MSLFTILGIPPDDLKALGDWLKLNYIENADELARMEHARLLDEFYEGRGDAEMTKVIMTMYTDQKNQDRRINVIKAGLDKYDNIVARIVREKATVYSEPPRRTISMGDVTYQAFLDVVQMDDAMREADRKLALHENVLLWYRVRQLSTGEREPLLEVVSPASFWAVSHPKDRTQLVAIIFDQSMPLAPPEAATYRVWTNDQTFVMNKKCEIFKSSIESWPLGVMPGVLASLVNPGSKPTLLTQFPSADLLSAQKGIRLQAINLAKESISAVNQTYISGDTSATTMGQTADTESEVFLGEGVTATTLNRGMDQEQFRDNGGYIGDAVASNHGLSPSVLRNRDASSGAEIELRLIPIRQLRKDRIPVLRRVEQKIAKVMALVNSSREVMDEKGQPMQVEGDLPDFAFDAEGFSIDFGEVTLPMTATEMDLTFEKRRQLGLTNTLDELKRRNPDLRTDDEARAELERNIELETQRIAKMKDMLAMSGSMGASTDQVANVKTPFEANRGQSQPATNQVQAA